MESQKRPGERRRGLCAEKENSEASLLAAAKKMAAVLVDFKDNDFFKAV